MGLEGQTIEELRARVMVASRLIKTLQQDDDPRAERAIEVLREQQREINEVLVRRIGEGRGGGGAGGSGSGVEGSGVKGEAVEVVGIRYWRLEVGDG